MIPSRGLSKVTGDLRSFAGISREFVSARGPLGGGLGRGATDAHLAERRYQSRSDDWLYRSLRRYVLRGGEKRRTAPERETERRGGEGGERGWRTKREIAALAPGHHGLSDTERLLRGGIIHQALLFFLSLSLTHSLSLSTSRFPSPSVCVRLSVFLHPHPATVLLRSHPASCVRGIRR